MKIRSNTFFLSYDCVHTLSALVHYYLAYRDERALKKKFSLKGVVFLDEYLALLGLDRDADDIIGLFQIDFCNFKNSSVMASGHGTHPVGHLGPCVSLPILFRYYIFSFFFVLSHSYLSKQSSL